MILPPGPLTILLLFLAAPDPLAELLDPSCRDFGLAPLETRDLQALPREARILARGFDAARYVEPPPQDDALLQDNAARKRLFPGFDYEGRLTAKRDAWAVRARREPVSRLLRLLDLVADEDPGAFEGRLRSLTRGIDAGRRDPAQALLALRHSERQWRDWWLGDLGARVAAAPSAERAKARADLARRLGARDPFARRLAARVAAAAGEAALLEKAAAAETDGLVLDALVAGIARGGGDRARDLLALWAGDPREAMRRAALRAAPELGEEWARLLMLSLVEREEGALRDLAERSIGRGPGGACDFFGIRTHSRRVLFCIDVSRSMGFPLDGEGGQREPRSWRTRRELRRTLEALPEDVAFDIALFGPGVTSMGGLAPATERHRSAALEFVEKAALDGGTNLDAALAHALGSGADTVFLLTDGEPSVGRMVDPALLCGEVAERNADGRVTFHAVGLSRDQNAEFLVNLAAANGGRYVAER